MKQKCRSRARIRASWWGSRVFQGTAISCSRRWRKCTAWLLKKKEEKKVHHCLSVTDTRALESYQFKMLTEIVGITFHKKASRKGTVLVSQHPEFVLTTLSGCVECKVKGQKIKERGSSFHFNLFQFLWINRDNCVIKRINPQAHR